jgi:hypothetical protein
MSKGRQDSRSVSFFLVVALLSLAAVPSLAQKQAFSPLDPLAFSSPALRVQPELAHLDDLRSLAGSASFPGGAPLVADWDKFLSNYGGAWTLLLDRRTGLPNLAQGSGVPWVPGRGNHLTLNDVCTYWNASSTVDTASVERMAGKKGTATYYYYRSKPA